MMSRVGRTTFRGAVLNVVAMVAVLSLSLSLGAGEAAAMAGRVSIEKVNLDGAQAKILFAHGYRRPDAPRTAPLRMKLYRPLLAEGWMVASTAYRRNGLIVRDAVEDLDNLRDHIARKHGEPQRVIVQGHSMGGLIGALLAESSDAPYDGVLAVGAALELREDRNPMVPSCRTLVPLLFLSNRDEIDGPRNYLSCAARALNRWEAELPILWAVDRDGHVNVTDGEIRRALEALMDWIENGDRPVENGDGRP